MGALTLQRDDNKRNKPKATTSFPCAFFAELNKLSSGVIFPPARSRFDHRRISETLSPASVFDQWHLDVGPGLERFERGQERFLAKTGSERPQVGQMSS